MRDYMENFSKTFLEGKAKFRFQTEVLDIQRASLSENGEPSNWQVKVKDLVSQSTEVLSFARIILATGVRFQLFYRLFFNRTNQLNCVVSQGCSNPKVPVELSPEVAEKAGYRGLVFHTSKFAQHLDRILEEIPPSRKDDKPETEDDNMVVVVGCGKSAQE